MGDQPVRARAAAIQEFADVLRALRQSAGDPSFREMAGRSRAISHTTLHEAAQGHRLPSWATTVEFVKACGGDPAEYRERWERADRAVRNDHRLPVDDAAAESESTDAASGADVTSGVTQFPRRRLRWLVAVAAAVVVAGGVAAAVAASSDGDSSAKKHGPSAGRPLTAADCPVRQSNPPSAPPAHSGDASEFIADIKLPDCAHVGRGQTVVKVWRLKNIGTVTWKGYSLHRLELPQSRDQCQTISDVPIPVTQPGQTVDIQTRITTPPVATFCFVRFKMLDAAGRVVFPGSRPVNFQLIVD